MSATIEIFQKRISTTFMNRKEEQSQVFVEFGALVGPLRKLADPSLSFDSDEKSRIIARYFADSDAFKKRFSSFTKSEPGHHYYGQLEDFCRLINQFEHSLMKSSEVGPALTKLIDDLYIVISSIPVPVDAAIHDAMTPFATYRLIQNLCTTAHDNITWMDRYFDHRVFHRFFCEVTPKVKIALVIWPRSKCQGRKDEIRYDQFMDVSRLFAQERGPDRYRLVTNEDIHARWLRCDTGLFNLGDSISALGSGTTFTIGKLDNTPENSAQLDQRLIAGTELFGPTQTAHL